MHICLCLSGAAVCVCVGVGLLFILLLLSKHLLWGTLVEFEATPEQVLYKCV